jgi:hypothetical protein
LVVRFSIPRIRFISDGGKQRSLDNGNLRITGIVNRQLYPLARPSALAAGVETPAVEKR